MDTYLVVKGKKIEVSEEILESIKNALQVKDKTNPLSISQSYSFCSEIGWNNIKKKYVVAVVDKRVYINQYFAEGSQFGKNCIFIKCKFEKNCNFGPYCKFGSNCNFGPYCKFGPYCVFGSSCKFDSYCKFGPSCKFGSNCKFWSLL